MENTVLEVKNLKAKMPTKKGDLHILNGVDFVVKEQECFGIIGESGCGKTMTAMVVLQYAKRLGLEVTEGEVLFQGENVLDFSKKRLREYNGKEVAIILQNPMEALDPLYTVKNQMLETIHKHQKVSKKEAYAIMEDVTKQLSIPMEKLDAYPHELSGGMLQRIVGAMVLICKPKLIIADEPTTALDVTIQLQYLKLLKKIQKENNISIIFVSHDMKVISIICDRVAVMYAGEVVEVATKEELFQHPKHPYTKALLRSIHVKGANVDVYETIEGTPPDLLGERVGCPYAPRCEYATKKCFSSGADTVNIGEQHEVKCHRFADDKE